MFPLPDDPATVDARTRLNDIDRQIGRILATLSARGYTNNIVVYAGLTGLPPDPDSNRKRFHDSAMKVPLVISGILGQKRNSIVSAPGFRIGYRSNGD